MKLANPDKQPWKLAWEDVASKTMFIGYDFGLSTQCGKDINDACVAIFYDKGWHIEGEKGYEAIEHLRCTIKKPQKRFIIISCDASLSRPFSPDYNHRECDRALNEVKDKKLSFQAKSYLKYRDLFPCVTASAKGKVVVLETHPQSNFPPDENNNGKVEYIKKAWKIISNKDNNKPPNHCKIDLKNKHIIDAFSAALVSLCYGRFKSNNTDKNEDYLSVVVDCDGTYWLLDADALQS
jgi:hypothetical protein